MRQVTSHQVDDSLCVPEAAVANGQVETDIRYPLSPLQEGMLIHSLAEKGVGMYVSQGVHLFKAINIEAMKQAWQHVVDRHEVLRTSFIWEGLEQPLQIVHPKVDVQMEIRDLQELSTWEQKIKLRALLTEDRNQGFDLTKPPLFRLILVKRSANSYYLVFSHHHLLLDGWSNPILLDEVRAFYRANLADNQVVLAQPQPFRRYIEWLQNQPLEEEKQFWQAYLKGFRQTTPLPYDLGADRQAGYALKSEEWPLELKGSAFSNLKTAAQRCHVTLNTMIQAAWVLLLSRYSERDEIVFGSLVSGRSSVLEGIEHMIGMFLNTLPMLVRVDRKASLKEWVKYVQQQQNALHEHEFSPLNLVQRCSELPRGSQLFESVIDTNNTHQPQGEGGGEDADDAVMAPINQSMPLLLFAKPAAKHLVLILIYNNRRFTRSCIGQVSEQLVTLLTAMSEDMDKLVGELTMISADEAQRTLVEWNKTKTEYPKDKTLHQLFEHYAAVTPEAPAIHHLGTTYSYKVFNQKANQLAHYLCSIGVGRGQLVAFCLDRSLDMAVTLMAILKSGATYVPLDPSYPIERLKLMLNSSGAQLLITQEKWSAQFNGLVSHSICFDLEAETWEGQAKTNLDLPLSPEDVAYVLYTSGSTGVPKGIVIPHKVPVNRMFIEFDPFEPDEALCAKTSICFVDSVWELWSAWANGLPITLIPEDHIKDPTKLIDTLAESGSTRMVLVPSLLRSMLDTAPDLQSRLPRMRHWICSGEALPGDLSARFVTAMPNSVLTNLYGATEIWDVTRCDTRDDLPFEPMPIGKIMGNMQGYVLDDMMRPVPVGIIGELYFSGVHVAHGYWKRPDLTARVFLPDPFSQVPGTRMYKTGDLGRWLPDGNFEYLGRIDHQVQLRGLRMELGDIESVIRQHPEITQTAVVISDDQRLVAYVVIKPETQPTSSELRKHVRLKLPEHMTPAFYLTIDDIPLTPNGKTDRRRLPKPKAEEMKQIIEAETISRPPETETEITVAGVWAKFLGLDQVGADSDFFQLGGESLMAVRIITEVGNHYRLSIPLSVLMKTRTVADMAVWIDETLASGTAEEHSDQPMLTKIEHGKKAPLSHAQQQMWLLDQLNPGSVSYTVPSVMQFRVKVDLKALETALTQIIERHEILRTTFSAIDGEPFQVINDLEAVTVLAVDLTDQPVESRYLAAQRQMQEQARIPWDLEQGPLFRYQLIKTDEASFTLAMTLHHIVIDGRSLAILSKEIEALYEAAVSGHPYPLPPLPLQYADYSIWQRDWLRGSQIESHIDYWKAKLEEVSVLDIPTDHPRPAVHRYRGGQVSVWLDKVQVNGLRDLALAEGATFFMALLTTFQVLLARHSGQYDICVGTPTANRSQPQLDRLIGYFVNTIVIRTRIQGNPSFRELLDDVRINCLEAYDHQDVPFEQLVDKLGVQRDLSHNPLFQVLFVHQKLAREQDDGSSITRQVAPEQETANFDLVLNAHESADRLECKLIFNADIFTPATIERMGAHLERLIRYVVDEPDRPLSEVPILAPKERHQVLHDFSQQPPQPLERRFAHEVIADHAAHQPGKTAICFGDDTLTYKQLDQRSNQVAHWLQHRGVGPETVVGWCVERSPEIFSGLLGILKAGGAFLPIDPAHPQERIAYMLKDTMAPLVVTQPGLAEKFPGEMCQVLLLDDIESIDCYPTTAPEVDLNPHNLAYVIYTSGSTGQPKGVTVVHQNLANLISAQIPLFNVMGDSRVLQTLSLSFDAAIGEIFRTLMAGATLHLAHKDDLMPGPTLIELLKRLKITNLTLSAAALGALPRVSDELPELKNLTVGGDSVSPELVEHWQKNRRFMNGYGPTETTIGATLAWGWDPKSKPPLGRPLPNVEAYVLDRWMQPVPIGTPGELYIGGIGVTRGYLNRSQQTAMVFVPNPFNEKPGDRLYRTGDLVRWLPDGQLDFLGRMDHQVKIRGYRIELSEIEAVLGRYPNVEQAVVVVHETDNVSRLAGYVTPTDEPKPDVGELRRYLKNSLPDYMVPAFLIVCDNLPLTVSGKVDRKALPKPSDKELQSNQTYVAPRTDLEKLVADIWKDVLGLEKVGIQSNYFELGGDSIMSIRVVARIGQAGYQLTLQEMFKHQTVAELAAAIESGGTVVDAEQGLVTGEVPLTPVQHWFFEQNSPDPHNFNQWMVIPTPPRPDFSKMHEATKALLVHHDALRMRYRQAVEGGWYQFNSGELDSVPFCGIDLSAVPESERAPLIEETFKHMNRSLDLERGPLFQVCWFDPGAHQSGRLLLVVHHMIIDIVSWTPLIEDLMTAYRQLAGVKEIKLPMKTSSFQDWANALVDYAHSQEALADVAYWSRQSERPPLPVDSLDGDNALATTRSLFTEMDLESTRQLTDHVVPELETQLSHLLLAALAVGLSDFSGHAKIQIKVEGQGREAIGVDLNLSRTLGWFTSFYPVFFSLDASQSVREKITAAIHDIEDIPNRGISYSVLRYMNTNDLIKEKMSSIPEPEVAFNFTGQTKAADTASQPFSKGEADWGRLAETGKIQLNETEQGVRRHLIEIGSGIMNGRLVFRFAYSKNRFTTESIQRLSDAITGTLKHLIGDLRLQPIQSLPRNDYDLASHLHITTD
jgi:amino acid adenylation domain-containing protein/non-ribosomal peptide synthase protein (TIGR01720 family)